MPESPKIEVQRWQDFQGLYDTATTKLTMHSLPDTIIEKYRDFEKAVIDHILQTIE
jgi:hypothetical protein